ncbi:hypothetical protein G5C51_18125 [Streptomyces sp. A7024]|uniref:Peptidase inhibitor n=1 Tax=Streptomyces coryli TaxID=1128680 RepID=A0A6G4U0X5_9ACTN|nr:hypothetical protein [Streptomyces coryli]NGN65804.1 hypothetical protein [Streptomyces coryli]
MRKRTIGTLVTTIAAGAALITPMAPASADDSASVRAGTVNGCKRGYVCVWTTKSWEHGNPPSLKFYRYGVHKLSGQHGERVIYNNQTGGATAQTCRTYSGTNCSSKLKPGKSWYFNISPINSIRLNQG